MTIWQMSAWKLLMSGGPVMIPIIFCSFFALAIIIEKFLYFASISIDIKQFKETIFEHIKANNIKEAIGACDANPSPLAKVLKAGILKFGSSRDEIKESMEDESFLEIPKLERKLTALATIANITPLLGLLGTVTGIAGSFHAIQMRTNSLNPVSPGDLAGGIWEALITTIAGLMIAIPSFVTYNYFVSRVHLFTLEMERGATELLTLMSYVSESKTIKKGNYQVEV